MKQFLYLFSSLCTLLLFQSCQRENCEGADRIQSFAQITLLGPDQITVDTSLSRLAFSLNLSQEISSRKGTRRCLQKDLAIQNEDQWNREKFSLTCEQSIHMQGTKVLANTELLDIPSVESQISIDVQGFIDGGSHVRLRIDTPKDSTELRFKIYGETTEGKVFINHHTVKLNL